MAIFILVAPVSRGQSGNSQFTFDASTGINYTGPKGQFAPGSQYSVGLLGMSSSRNEPTLYISLGFLQKLRRSKLIEQDYWYPTTDGEVVDTFSYRTKEVFTGIYLSWGVQGGIGLNEDLDLLIRCGLTHSGAKGAFSWRYVEEPDVEDTRHDILGQGGYFQNEFNFAVGLRPMNSQGTWSCFLQYAFIGSDQFWLFDQLSGYQALELKFVLYPNFSP